MKSVAIVIAAYNEEQRVQKTIHKVLDQGYKNIIVVDDGSTDNTVQILKKLPVTLLEQTHNQGQGAALRRGTQHALENGYECIVHYDADGQFHANEIKEVLKPLQNNTADIVFGSRFKGVANNISKFKVFILKLGSIFLRIIGGVYLTDSQNGFRAMNKKAATQIEITFNRMEHASQIIVETGKQKLRYAEVPVTVEYHEAGQHPLRSIKMGFRLLWWRIRK